MGGKNIIAIDGPAGAGKSTVARLLAKRLGYIYIDTGAMYRAITWKCLQTPDGLEPDKVEEISQHTEIVFKVENEENKVFVDGNDVTHDIRTPEITAHVSAVSSYRPVREVLSRQQKALGQDGKVVMDGRDIGTCIFPDAEYKFFLTASVKERATRRYKELIAKGHNCSLEQLKTEIMARDHADSNRSISPLKQAEDAIFIDSSELSIDETVEAIYKICAGS